MRFSQRIGVSPIRVDIQRTSMDTPLRNKLWTAIELATLEWNESSLQRFHIELEVVSKRMWVHFFHEPIDTTPRLDFGHFRNYIRQWFFKSEWYQVYDFVEFLYRELENAPKKQLEELVNHFLEGEHSAYRLVNGVVSEITSESEIEAIREAAGLSGPMKPVTIHLQTALEKLTDRKAPDYRNSIKESISAVEAMCKLLTGEPKATLGQAIKKLKGVGLNLHPSMEAAWLKLYGFTSDEHGIRHALTEEPTVSFAEAKYVLVTSSAFVNYLFEVARQSGVLQSKP